MDTRTTAVLMILRSHLLGVDLVSYTCSLLFQELARMSHSVAETCQTLLPIMNHKFNSSLSMMILLVHFLLTSYILFTFVFPTVCSYMHAYFDFSSECMIMLSF